MMPAAPPGDRPAVATPLALGGWVAPALLALAFVSLSYVAAHGTLLALDGLIAAAGMMLMLALSVATPSVVRGSLLTVASPGPIAWLGRGPDVAMSPSVSPRRRTVAIVAGAASSGAIAILALALSRGEEILGYPHAITTLAFGANVALAARALVPIPGIDGWALLLSVIDWRRPGDRRRITRTSRAAKLLAIPVTLLVSAIGLALSVPLLAAPGILLGLLVWTQADLAENRDILDRYLARHTADDVALPLTAFLRADDPVQVSSATRPGVSMVVGPLGELLGFIGPRQVVRALAVIEQPVACRDAMVPVGMAPLLPSRTPASALPLPIDRYGFAVIRVARGLGYVESGDLTRQAHRWSVCEGDCSD